MEISSIKIGRNVYDVRDNVARNVVSNNNTASWGSDVVVGNVAGTDLKFKMPQKPESSQGTTYNSGTTQNITTGDTNDKVWAGNVIKNAIESYSGVNKNGTVTSIATGKGLTGGTITSTGTINLNLASSSSLGTINSTEDLYAIGVDSNNKLCVLVPQQEPESTEKTNGVFAITASGQEVKYQNIDTSNTSKYVGVVVRDMDKGIEFFFDKNLPLPQQGDSWSESYAGMKAFVYTNNIGDQSYLLNISGEAGDGTSISSAATSAVRTAAFGAYNSGQTGIVNTNNIINDNSITSDTAANSATLYCRSVINPITGLQNGYLGSLAEWIVVNDQQVEINRILQAIGGVTFTGQFDTYGAFFWTSCEYDSTKAWGWYCNPSGYPRFLYTSKKEGTTNYVARPFFPLS